MSTAPQFGPRPAADGGVTFSLWAPAAKSVEVITSRAAPMQRGEGGWFQTAVADAKVGTRYRFRIDGELQVPDPASSFQPDDVMGQSEVINHLYSWQATSWRGRPWHEAVLLEIHIGTFTPTGTFLAAIDKLDEVVQSGFTAIELMPVADFPGRWNWGYDGVLWFAPDSAYGRPEDLRALIDAAHLRGLMVILDVVYNHFGPEGNFLPRYAPSFFNADAQTPWGSAIDYAVPEVRVFVLQNVLHWLGYYRFDGLRFDAVHAIAERGMPTILEDISKAAGRLARETNRLIHLVLENDGNEASLLDPLKPVSDGKYRAQWNDDFHHAWHVLLTGETLGYYEDYSEPLNDIARILRSGFAYQGQNSKHRGGKPRGELSGHLSPLAFVSFLQNHDQIGNRALGERLESIAPPERIEAALSIMLLAPMPPLMFMGEEWGEARPFRFFCDFRGDLAQAVREGRRKEFQHAYENLPADQVPDPVSELTYMDSAIRWDTLDQLSNAKRRHLVQRLLACRASEVVPHLANVKDMKAEAMVVGTVLTASWQLDGGTLHLKANLGDEPAAGKLPPGNAIWNHQQPVMLPPWSVFWTWEG